MNWVRRLLFAFAAAAAVLASGAALAVLILRAALACHTGMATFAQAGVSDKPADEEQPRAAG